MNQTNLIIIVKDLDNKLVNGAKVTLNSGNLTGKTDEKGQVSFPLPNAKKVDIKVELNGKTNSTTYYLTGTSDQRLEVNFAFYKKFQESQSLLINNKPQTENLAHIFGFLLILIIVILGGWLILKKYQRLDFRKIRLYLKKIIKFKKN